MNNISFWKKISLYLSYRKCLRKNKEEFLSKYNLRIDRINRIYTVVNVPEDMFEAPYNTRTADINKISEPYISEYIKKVSGVLNSKGLSELYMLYDIQKIDKYSYLVIIGFILFNTDKMAKNIYFKILPAIAIISLITFIIFKLV